MDQKDEIRVNGVVARRSPLILGQDIRPLTSCGGCKHFRRLNKEQFCGYWPPLAQIVMTQEGAKTVGIHPPVQSGTASCGQYETRGMSSGTTHTEA